MKVIFSSLDKNKSLGGWQETAVYIEEALQEDKIDYTVIRPPDPSKIGQCDVFYEGSFVPEVSRQSFNAVRAKSPRAAFVLQLISAHPNVYYNIYHDELKKYGLKDERFDAIWTRSFRGLIAEADVIFCHSKWIKKTLIREHIPEDAICVVPKGVDTNFWQPIRIPKGVFRIGFAGQLQVIKGLHYLFEAWEKLGSPGELWVCGPKITYVVNGQRVWSCGKLYEKHMGASYKGWFRRREDLKTFYSSLDVFVAPSLEDGWNMTAVEAMSCSKPVIVTSTTGMSQIVEDGVNGFVVPPGDVEQLMEKIMWCKDHQDLLPGMGAAARNTVLKYDVVTYKRNFMKALRSCVGRRSQYIVHSPEEWTQKQVELFGGQFFAQAKQRIDENQLIVKLLKSTVKPQCEVLDVGCLDGSISELLLKWGCKVVACDLPEIASRARELHPDFNILSLDLNHDFPKGQYDVIFASSIVEHLYNDFFFLCNCYKALKPGGVLIISTVGFDDWHAAHLRIYPERQFRTLLTMVGFTSLDFSNSVGERLTVVASRL